MKALSRIKSSIERLLGRGDDMCCSVDIKREDRTLSAIRSQQAIRLPLRILGQPSQSDIAATRRDFPILARQINGHPVVYLDNACMSLRPKAVIDAITGYYTVYSGCHGRGEHHFGTETTNAYNAARRGIQEFIGARRPAEVLFVRNATEGINAVAGMLPFKSGDVVLCSDIEHNSNLLPWLRLNQTRGVEHRVFHTNPDTTFNMSSFLSRLDSSVKLVSIPHTSNLTGVTFPVGDIVREAHRVGAKVLVDAAQGMVDGEIDVRDLDVDFLVFSGHKMLGPTGIGVLYGREELLKDLPCFLMGGETVTDTTYEGYTLGEAPDRYEAGLQNYAGAIGLGAAAAYLKDQGAKRIRKQIRHLNTLVTEELAKTKGITLIGPPDPALRSGILTFQVEGLDAADVSYLLNEGANIMTRAGKHCVHSWYNAHGQPNSVRASFSFYNTPEEVEFFVWTLRDIMRFYIRKAA